MNDQYTFFDLTLRSIDKIIERLTDKCVDFGYQRPCLWCLAGKRRKQRIFASGSNTSFGLNVIMKQTRFVNPFTDFGFEKL